MNGKRALPHLEEVYGPRRDVTIGLSGDLLSRFASKTVSSALGDLTSEFGMDVPI